jgi:integrase
MAVYKSNDKTKDGRQWFFKTYKKDNEGNNKAYKSKKYATKREAEESEALFLLKRDNPSHKKISTVADAYFEYLSNKSKESTCYSHFSCYNTHIKPYFEQKDIYSIKVLDINNWKETLQKKGYSINYLNKVYIILKNIFDYAVKFYGLSNNVVANCGNFQKSNEDVVEDDKKLRYITFEQFEKFISVIEDKEWFAFFNFLYFTGMRKGEIQALTWNDIDFDNKIIIVNKTLSVKTREKYKITSTKNNVNRKITINNALLDIMKSHKEYMKSFKDFSDNWFVFGGQRFLAQTNIDRMKKKYFELADVEEITIHEFRHSCVSLLINQYIKKSKEKNMKVDTAKFFIMMSNRMGHSIEVMQKVYLHLFPTIQDEIVELLDEL